MALSGQLVTVKESSMSLIVDRALTGSECGKVEGGLNDKILRTFSAISKLHMRRLLRGTKGIKHLGPAPSESEGEEEA